MKALSKFLADISDDCSDDSIKRASYPYNLSAFHCLPELVHELFLRIPLQLGIEDCQYYICQFPILVNPKTKHPFAFACGNIGISFLLPDTSKMHHYLGYNCRRYLENMETVYFDLRELTGFWVLAYDDDASYKNIIQDSFSFSMQT